MSRDVDPRYLDMLIAYEDKRFRSHHGVDPMAHAARGMAARRPSARSYRAARHSRCRWRACSSHAANARMMAKLKQMVRAIELERRFSKDEILSLYLSLAPYGGNLEGIRSASLAYFDKEPKRLSRSEAALLVALPQSPEARRPDRSPDRAQRARDPCARSHRRRMSASPTTKSALRRRSRLPTSALGRCRRWRRMRPIRFVVSAPQQKRHELTIDARMQRALETLARERAPSFGTKFRSRSSWSIMRAAKSSRVWLRRITSTCNRAGQVDLTQALRSPGSALKPFIYGLAFEDGVVHPDTLIDDQADARYGNYAPENFDLTFQGIVPVRKALQLSLNVPAVRLARSRRRFASHCAAGDRRGGRLTLPKGEVPGLAMGLGGVGVTLSDLTMLYTGLARQGSTIALVERKSRCRAGAGAAPSARSGRGLVCRQRADRHAAAENAAPQSDRLQDRHLLRLSRCLGGRLRRSADHWRVGRAAGWRAGAGHSRSHCRGADPVRCLCPAWRSASAAAARAQGDNLRHQRQATLLLQRFSPDGLTGRKGEQVRIMFPPNGARLELSSKWWKPEPVVLKISGGGRADDHPRQRHSAAGGIAGGRTIFFDPRGRASSVLTVVDGKGTADSVMVRLR